MLKQDLLVAIVSVFAIVYVILFDTSGGGLFNGPGTASGPVNPLAPYPVSGSATPRTTDVTPLDRQDGPEPEAGLSGLDSVREPLLAIRPEGSLTPSGRTRLIEEARGWLARPIPGEFARLKEDFESIGQLAESLALYRISPDEKLSRAFGDKLSELKRTYLLQRATLMLGEIASSYSIPSPAERDRVKSDLARLRELARNVSWVEERYSFVYPRDRKDYLAQILEVLEGMDKMNRTVREPGT